MQAIVTMRDAEDAIDRRFEVLDEHPFLVRLDGEGSRAELLALLPRLAFFVFAFQDFLALAQHCATEAAYRDVIRGLRDGDRGHEQWYLDDLARLGLSLDVPSLFAADQRVVRDTSYGLAAHIVRAEHDCLRLTVLLGLEAAARHFFRRIAGFAARSGVVAELRYFGGQHIAAEEAHDVYSDDGRAALAGLSVPSGMATRVSAVTEDVLQLMTGLANELAQGMKLVRASLSG